MSGASEQRSRRATWRRNHKYFHCHQLDSGNVMRSMELRKMIACYSFYEFNLLNCIRSCNVDEGEPRDQFSQQKLPEHAKGKATELLLCKNGLQLRSTALVPGLAYKRQGKATDIASLKLELPAQIILWSPRVKTPLKTCRCNGNGFRIRHSMMQ